MTEERSLEIVKQEGGTALSAHIDRDLFCGWQEGRLKEEEETAFLEHIGSCTFCAERFGDWMEEAPMQQSPIGDTGLPAPPRYLKEEIQKRAHQLDIQAARRIKETSRQMQLLLYSMKVGVAVALSIFLLVLTANLQNMDLEPSKGRRIQQMEEWHREAQEHRENGEPESGLINSLRRGSREITGTLNDLSNGLFRMGVENENNQEVTR